MTVARSPAPLAFPSRLRVINWSFPHCSTHSEDQSIETAQGRTNPPEKPCICEPALVVDWAADSALPSSAFWFSYRLSISFHNSLLETPRWQYKNCSLLGSQSLRMLQAHWPFYHARIHGRYHLWGTSAIQTPTLLTLWSQFPNIHSCQQQLSNIYELPSLWYLCCTHPTFLLLVFFSTS